MSESESEGIRGRDRAHARARERERERDTHTHTQRRSKKKQLVGTVHGMLRPSGTQPSNLYPPGDDVGFCTVLRLLLLGCAALPFTAGVVSRARELEPAAQTQRGDTINMPDCQLLALAFVASQNFDSRAWLGASSQQPAKWGRPIVCSAGFDRIWL